MELAGHPAPVHGGSNRVYACTASNGQHYYLKRKSDKGKIEQEIVIHHALSRRGLYASHPAATVAGKPYARHENDLFCLYEPVEGRVVSVFDETVAFQYGKAIALLHLGLSEIPQSGLFSTMNIEKQMEEWAIPAVEAALDSSRQAAFNSLAWELRLHGLDRLDALPTQLIHRDPNPTNLLLREDGSVGYLDFEIATFGLRIFDIAYCSTGMLMSGYRDEAFRSTWTGLLRGVLDGYQSECKLERQELECLFDTIVAIQLIFGAYFIGTSKELSELNISALFWIVSRKQDILSAAGCF
ncbi:phosphotransferase enzyme family protein [Paenibacillus sp. MBLB4367]|uniref:phosphotransferase enzyme family protein n=1 Tax=Paenibacillus sp. MBLB4367 TaxID=3384767 RepID=UPI003907EFD4